MKKIILLVSIMMFCLSISAENDSVRVERMLREARTMPSDTNWMMYFGRQFLGQPYVGGTLDRTQEEELIVNLSELDCTTYIETIAALSHCAMRGQTAFADYKSWLRQIRYIDGEVSYIKRQHYFNIWMEANEKQRLTETIENDQAPFSATFTPVVNWMTKHVSSYKMLTAHPEWRQGIRDLESTIDGKTYRYIPLSQLKPTKANNKLLKQYIKDGDIIVLMTNKTGLDTQHITMAHWQNDGLHVIHASSYYKKVIDDPITLYSYIKQRPTIIGIRICRVKGND